MCANDRMPDVPDPALPDEFQIGDHVPRVVVGSAAELVAVVPYLLGFHPSAGSVVAVGSHGPQGTSALRLDLPDADDTTAVMEIGSRLADILSRERFGTTVLVGYGDVERIVAPLGVLAAALIARGLKVADVLRVHDGRWWSYLCPDSECCPPEGTPYDIRNSVIAAHATVAGQVVYADRAEVAASIAPVDGAARRAMRAATDRAELRLETATAGGYDFATLQAYLVQEGVPLVQELLERARNGGKPITDDEIAWLGIVLCSLRVRDEALVRTDTDSPAADIAFWSDVVRRIEPSYAAPPATVLAYTAYVAGEGVLANFALDRADHADPGYTLAHLLRRILIVCLPPDKAKLDLTPEQLDALYDSDTACPRDDHPPSTDGPA